MGIPQIKTRPEWSKNCTQKYALWKAIKKAGSQLKLATLINCHQSNFYYWKNRPNVTAHTNLMDPEYALAIQDAVKIKGLAIQLAPSLKKWKEKLKKCN